MKKALIGWTLAGVASTGIVLAQDEASTQLAQPSSYVEVGYGWVTVADNSGYSLTPSVAIAKGGFNLNSNFAAEVVGVGTVRAVDIDNGFGYAAVSVHGYGGYLKGMIGDPMGFQAYAKAGYFESTLVVAQGGAWISESDSSPSYGFGVQWADGAHAYIGVEYMSYYDKSGVQARGPSLNLGYKF